MLTWKEKDKKELGLIIVVMFALAWAAMKLSLPALPTLIHVFHTTPSTIKLSVSLFFASYALSQLFWGAIAEKHGRRRVILTGVTISCIGTLFVIFSQSITVYILGRCLEGIGIGVVSPVGRAVLADVFEKIEMGRRLSVVSASTGIMPALAPILGGFILVWFGWRYIFVFFLAILFSFLCWSFLRLKESNPHPKKEQSLKLAIQTYVQIAGKKVFWAYIICYALTQGALLGYYGAMPFWYVSQWHIPDQYYAFLGIFNVSAYVIALMITRSLIKKMPLETLVRIGVLIGSCAVIFAFASALLHFTGPAPLIITLTILALSSGMIFPTSNAAALSYFKSESASMSALSSTSMFLMAALFSWIESHLNVRNLWQLAVMLLIVNVVVLTINTAWMPKGDKAAG